MDCLDALGHITHDARSEETDGKLEVIGNIYENGELIGKYPDSFTSEAEQATRE
jgi:hypothetical protein